MKLLRFRVTNFRSVKDSGWIVAENVTALIGVNESGKTNLLLPLWKLKPAQDGEIEPIADYPKDSFSTIREAPGDFYFIEAEFDSSEHADRIGEIFEEDAGCYQSVRVRRYFDGRYEFEYPDFKPLKFIPKEGVATILDNVMGAMSNCSDDDVSKLECLDAVKAARKLLDSSDEIDAATVESLMKIVDKDAGDASPCVDLLSEIYQTLEHKCNLLRRPPPEQRNKLHDHVVDILPHFVYYSNYGNLDSEIYLPHVVENLRRDDLAGRLAAQTRTLRVLFKFVGLDPKEIMDLGDDAGDKSRTGEPTQADIEKSSEQKRVRSTLLESAETKLTKDFKEWWKQGDYTFTFQADGKHFRILVSDAKRPAKVELEGRSTGLQWFLSFYLVFLVESMGIHKNCVLLLDEPGVSLHPLAQMDLIKFFEALSKENQILYTTHSPFLIDANRLDQARKVFVDKDGTTKASDNLRQDERDKKDPGAAYAVHSALGLRVAESLMIGCAPVIVEGPSDQHYLTAVKTLLIKAKKLNPGRELVFPPCGGTPQVRSVAAILGSRDDSLPYVLLDGDKHGQKAKSDLQSSTYRGEKGKVLLVDAFTGLPESEIEDLMPVELLAKVLDKVVNQRPDIDFVDYDKTKGPIVPQIEAWAKDQEVTLPEDWKVSVSMDLKKRLLNMGIKNLDNGLLDKWEALFKAFSDDGKT
jgi:energy-coupling factor transporter ATP-binding protein EcfA2